jgi:hypothetical protein
MRPLYDHYRKVKRLLTKANGKNFQNITGDENENLDDDELMMINNMKDQKHFLNLHALTLPELNKEKEVIVIYCKTKLYQIYYNHKL